MIPRRLCRPGQPKDRTDAHSHPSVEYFLLSPMLIVFGIAVAGVLVEAFLPRRTRYGAQVALTLAGLVAAFVAVIAVSRSVPASGRAVVLGAMAIDRPTLYLQGTVLLVAVLAVIFMAERTQARADSKVALSGRGGGLGRPGFLYAAGLRGSRQRASSSRRSGPASRRRSSSRSRCCPSAG